MHTLIKAAVNGGRGLDEHPGVALTAAAIAVAARDAVAAGADVVHAHARRADGSQTIDPDDVRAMVEAVRTHAPGTVLGTTTGLWTCTDHLDRMRKVEAWPDDAPLDFASVAFCEQGAAEAAQLVLDKGLVLESAVWWPADLPALLASPTLHRNVRILIEPEVEDAPTAVAMAREMAARIRAEGVTVPILYHGYDATAWPLVRAAFADGCETRVGFEDMLLLEDGTVPADTAAMVRAARCIERGTAGLAH